MLAAGYFRPGYFRPGYFRMGHGGPRDVTTALAVDFESEDEDTGPTPDIDPDMLLIEEL